MLSLLLKLSLSSSCPLWPRSLFSSQFPSVYYSCLSYIKLFILSLNNPTLPLPSLFSSLIPSSNPHIKCQSPLYSLGIYHYTAVTYTLVLSSYCCPTSHINPSLCTTSPGLISSSSLMSLSQLSTLVSGINLLALQPKNHSPFSSPFYSQPTATA